MENNCVHILIKLKQKSMSVLPPTQKNWINQMKQLLLVETARGHKFVSQINSFSNQTLETQVKRKGTYKKFT